jgi:hypothetical protein
MTLKINRVNLKELVSIRVQIPNTKQFIETPMDEFFDTKIEALDKKDLLYNIRDLQRIILNLKEFDSSIEFDISETDTHDI